MAAIAQPTTTSSPPPLFLRCHRGCSAVLLLPLPAEYEFPQMQKVKEMLKNPGAFAAAAAAAAPAAAAGGGGKAEAAAAAEEEEEEDDADMGFSLFD